MRKKATSKVSAKAKTRIIDEQAAAICKAVASDFKLKGLTQVGAAQLLNVDPKSVANQVSGRRPFGKKTAKLYAETFGYSEPFLLHGEGQLLSSAGSPKAVRMGDQITLSAHELEDLKERIAYLEKSLRRIELATPGIIGGPSGLKGGF